MTLLYKTTTFDKLKTWEVLLKEEGYLSSINPFLNNQNYLNRRVKIEGDSDAESFIVHLVRGQYFIGFTDSDQHRTVNICVHPIVEVSEKRLCQSCDFEFWSDELKAQYIDYDGWLKSKDVSLCEDCFNKYQDGELSL